VDSALAELDLLTSCTLARLPRRVGPQGRSLARPCLMRRREASPSLVLARKWHEARTPLADAHSSIWPTAYLG
jgi:hypothetical protein